MKGKLNHHTDEYKLFAKAATDACRQHLPTVQVRKREKPWVHQDIHVARDAVSTAIDISIVCSEPFKPE